MSKYIVETYYTCSFKIVHKLDELNEKKLSELEKRNDGEVQIIDVKLNSRKTKTANNKKLETSLEKQNTKNSPILFEDQNKSELSEREILCQFPTSLRCIPMTFNNCFRPYCGWLGSKELQLSSSI